MAWRCNGFKSHQLHWLWGFKSHQLQSIYRTFLLLFGAFGCDTGMKLPDHIKPMTGFQIGNSVLLPEGPAGLDPAQKMRKTRPWLLSDVNTVFSSGSLVHRQPRRLTGGNTVDNGLHAWLDCRSSFTELARAIPLFYSHASYALGGRKFPELKSFPRRDVFLYMCVNVRP